MSTKESMKPSKSHPKLKVRNQSDFSRKSTAKKLFGEIYSDYFGDSRPKRKKSLGHHSSTENFFENSLMSENRLMKCEMYWLA